MGIKLAMVGATQGIERSKFKHDRLLWMAPMILQPMIDKKPEICLIPISRLDELVAF
ncbi:hypothetical protein Q1J68_23215 [Pseudomonas pergaminensis]|uniref:hypothetical protein n=1 Tax=Pseudomonas pergaminensis TaxID=2853159 RepID=UPI0034D46228